MIPRVFKNRSFLLLWCARTISLLGDAFFEMGLTLLIYDKTGSTIAMGMNLIMYFVPSWIFGFIGGAAADKYTRKTIMVLSDLMRGLILMFLPVFISGDNWTPVLIYAATFVLSTLGQFCNPASGAILPQIVEGDSLVAANSAMNTMKQLVGIVGPALAGIIIKQFGTIATIYANMASFFISCALVSMIRIAAGGGKSAVKEKDKGFYSVIVEGLSYVAKRADLKVLLMLMVILNALLGPLNVILPVYADNVLGAEVAGYSSMLSGYSVGSLAGAALVGIFMKFAGIDALIAIGIAAIGIGLATLGIFANLYYAMTIMAVAGIGAGIISVIVSVMIQKTTPEDLLGRVLSTMGIIGTTTAPLSIAVTSVLLNYISPNTFFIICGFIALAFFAWYAVYSRARGGVFKETQEE